MPERYIPGNKQILVPKLASVTDQLGLNSLNNEGNTLQVQDQPEEGIRNRARNFIDKAEKAQAQYDLRGTDAFKRKVGSYLRAANALLTKSGS